MKKRRITIMIEDIPDDVDEILVKLPNDKSKGCKVNSKNNFNGCANYLTQLFYMSGKKYSCTRTKLGKILSILAFKYYVKEGELLFTEQIYKYPNCGTAISALALWPRYIYICWDVKKDDKKIISLKELNPCVVIPPEYQGLKEISSEIVNAIRDVFSNFGAYSTTDLSGLLNPIIEFDGVCNKDDSVNLEAIANLDKTLFKGNKVIEYIFKE